MLFLVFLGNKRHMYEERGRKYMKIFSEMIVNFLVRMVVGITLIFFINQFLVSKDISVSVGINPVTAVTSGTLGVPGVCLLYGIVLYEGF